MVVTLHLRVQITQENIFPPTSMDKGYGQLLQCQDLLAHGYELAKYV